MSEDRTSLRPQLILFFGAVVCIAAAIGIHESIFNNFLADTFSLSAKARGWLEFPRELPGLLVVVMAGILWALPVTRLGMVGALILAGGLVGIAVFGDSYWPMVLMMVLASAGVHLLAPVGSSIALDSSNVNNRGWRIGQMRAIGTVGLILGTGFVWLVFDHTSPQYRMGFLLAAAIAGLGGIIYGLMHIPHLHHPRGRLVVRRRYWLYYLLEFVFGARKQIFLTFGPWVLIKIYGQPATAIAGLLMTAALIGIVFKPLTGLAIDRFGERAIMVIDGLVLSVVCICYGYATRIAEPDTARVIACGCYIADNLLFSLGSARVTYLARLTNSPQEITSTLAMGTSINHIASMTLPAVGGVVWVAFGYQRVFLAAAVLAVAIAALSTLVPARGKDPAPA